MKKGMALITVIWIIAILTVLTTVLVYLTTSDIAYTFIFSKQRVALSAAEYGKNDVISKIPRHDLLAQMTASDSVYINGAYDPAHKYDIRGVQSYLISPMPFPPGVLKWGTGGRWLQVFDFNACGRASTAKGNIERVIDVGAAYENPMTSVIGTGHTMY